MSQVKQKTGIVESVKNIKRIIGTVNYEIGWYFDLIEKVFKVFSWSEPRTSDLILWLLIVAFLVVTFVPIRPLIALALIKKFHVESKFYKRKFISNYEIASTDIRNFFYYNNCYDFNMLFRSTKWQTEGWPTGFKPEDLKLLLQKRLEIVIPDEY